METKYYLVYGTKISSYGTLENLSRRVERRSYSDKKDVLDKKGVKHRQFVDDYGNVKAEIHRV